MGGSKTQIQPASAAPTAQQSAQDVLEAQLATNPRAAQQSFEINTNPQYGIQPFTQYLEDTRRSVLPQESAVRDQLVQNILANLISPTGISADQQSAIDFRRGQSQDEITRALRTRANLGGGLYGGRAGLTEQNAVRDLQAGFAQEDIIMQERTRNNAIQSALPLLSILYPEIGITAPQFESPAPSGNNALSVSSASRGQDINQAIAEAQNRTALQSALYQGLGQAGGAAITAFAGCWVASEIFGGWHHPKTCNVRYFIGNIAPVWFREFYIKYGERFAKYISDKPFIKLMLRPLFEVFSMIGERSMSHARTT